jgi:DnaK suppressor protein
MPKFAHECCTPEKLGEFQRTLHEKADEVGVRLSAAHAAEVVQRPEEPLDFGDWCQKSHDEWLFLNQNRLEIALLRDIQEALRRLEAGTFGICQECSEPISAKRLEAVPWAKFCLPCQERMRSS